MKFKEWLLGSHQKSFDLPEQEKTVPKHGCLLQTSEMG